MDFQSLVHQCLPSQVSIRKPGKGSGALRQGLGRGLVEEAERTRLGAREPGLKIGG